MSFPFGSSFRDKASGKTGDEIFDDMLKNIKQRKKEFFESPPKWRSTGMFDDLGSAGGSRFQSHLGDLAARHPEIADHLLDLLPEESKTGTIPKTRGKAEVHKNTSLSKNKKEANPQTVTIGTQTGGLESDIKLRNTVPDMQATSGESVTDGDRGQRSQSAPPQAPTVPSKPQQIEEGGVRLIPIRTESPCGLHQMPSQLPQIPRPPSQQGFQKPHSTSSHFQQAPQQSQPQPHFQQQHDDSSKGPTVRHIPIFVEGRDEPLLPKDAAATFGSKRGGCQGKPEQHQEKKRQPEQQQNHHEQHHHQKQHHSQQQSQPQPQPQCQQNQQQQSQQSQSQTFTPPPPPPKPDPLAQVAEIVKEVEALSSKVNEWKGTSRTDKEYIFLDEMLTRNLLKLDNIETEGRDEVRTARKEAIRRIQEAISVLESKSDQYSSQKAQENCQQDNIVNSCEEKIEAQTAESTQSSASAAGSADNESSKLSEQMDWQENPPPSATQT